MGDALPTPEVTSQSRTAELRPSAEQQQQSQATAAEASTRPLWYAKYAEKVKPQQEAHNTVASMKPPRSNEKNVAERAESSVVQAVALAREPLDLDESTELDE